MKRKLFTFTAVLLMIAGLVMFQLGIRAKAAFDEETKELPGLVWLHDQEIACDELEEDEQLICYYEFIQEAAYRNFVDSRSNYTYDGITIDAAIMQALNTPNNTQDNYVGINEEHNYGSFGLTETTAKLGDMAPYATWDFTGLTKPELTLDFGNLEEFVFSLDLQDDTALIIDRAQEAIDYVIAAIDGNPIDITWYIDTGITTPDLISAVTSQFTPYTDFFSNEVVEGEKTEIALFGQGYITISKLNYNDGTNEYIITDNYEETLTALASSTNTKFNNLHAKWTQLSKQYLSPQVSITFNNTFNSAKFEELHSASISGNYKYI